MEVVLPTLTAWPESMPAAFSRARSRPTCQCSNPRLCSWSSTSSLRKHSVSQCRSPH